LCDSPNSVFARFRRHDGGLGARRDPGAREGRRVKVAYLILAHCAPEQLVRLVGSLPEDSPVLIHVDRRANPAVYKRCVDLMAGRPVTFVSRHACRWGAFGIVQGTMTLINALDASGVHFDYATLLSGADYPIKSNGEIAAFLGRNKGAEFIESFSVMKPNRWSGHGGHYKAPEKVLCRHLRFRSRVMRIPGLRRMPAGLEPFGGSQWWTLSREAITYIARFVENTPKLVSFSKQSFIPDESFVQTIISNSSFASRVTGSDHRVIVWDRPAPPYPATLTMNDLDMLLASDCLFARKFDAKLDSKILDALDEHNSPL
jgi:Core-2/I-Branching enzyme